MLFTVATSRNKNQRATDSAKSVRIGCDPNIEIADGRSDSSVQPSLTPRSLPQFIDCAFDGLLRPLSVSLGVSHDGFPLQAHVRGPVTALQDQGLQAAFFAERVVRGVPEEIVHSFLPNSSLDSLNDRRHPSVKFPGH